MRVVSELDPELSARAVCGDGASVFHTVEMARVFADTPGYRPRTWAVLDDTGHPVVILPLVEIRALPRPLGWISTRAVAYGGLFATAAATDRHASLLAAAYREAMVGGRCLLTELRHPSSCPVARGLERSGFVSEPHLSITLDVGRPEAEILAGVGRRTRKAIRRGLRRRTVRVRALGADESLQSWYSVVAAAYRRNGVLLAPPALFDAVQRHLVPLGMARFVVAEVEGRVAAATLELAHGRVVTGWYEGVDRRFGSHSPNEMLLWNVFAWATRNGFARYDFGGGGHPDRPYGPRRFKLKFGGSVRQTGRHTLVHAPYRLRAATLGYEIQRRVRAARPVSAT